MESDHSADVIRRYTRGEWKSEVFDEIEKTIRLKTKLIVFVSSTFTDTHLERDLLHKQILPQLQKLAVPENIQVILYDMRFGVKDENTKDHMTWPICKDGIRQCFEESDGMFFLSMQGYKYGYCPVPKYVGKNEMLEAFRRVEDQGELLKKLSTLFEEWFELDENNIPPRYELKALQSLEDKVFYSEVLPAFRDELLHSTTFGDEGSCLSLEPEENSFDLVVGRSVTEWETLFALSFDSNNVGRCHWIRRYFNQQSLQSFKEYPERYFKLTDVVDGKSQSLKLKLDILKRKMKSVLLLKNGITKLENRISADNYLTMTEDTSKGLEDIVSYLDSWRLVTENVLKNEIAKLVDHNSKLISFLQSSFNLSFEYFEEISHHISLWKKKCSSFIGREDLLEKALEMLSVPVEKHGCVVSLALIGKSGTGKTGIISMMAKKVSEHQSSTSSSSSRSIPVIIRYCGTSQYSLHGMDLIQSICMQLLMIYEDKQSLESFMKGLSAISYERLIVFFHGLLSKYPVYLFIDSLDQLSNRNEARSKLHFLLSASLHEQSKVVVSALPDEKNERDGRFQYLYFCEHRLKQFNAPILTVEALVNGEEEIRSLVLELLRRRQRTFSSVQWEVVWSSAVQEPTILYVNLAVEIIHRWRSFDRSVTLAPTVKGIIDQLFAGLEVEYGSWFTRMCFAFIAYSREGMNDIEMKDCLSLSDDVLGEVFQYSKLESFPMHVWLRLKFVIKNLIAEKEGHCIKWHHRQIWERAEVRYGSLKNSAHEIMGKYFANLIDEDTRKRRSIHEQPLTLNEKVVWLSSCKMNVRRVKEGYYNLVEANLKEDSIKEMCSLEMVYASAVVGDGYNFVAYLGILSSKYLQSKDKVALPQRLDHYYRWVKKEITMITLNPRLQVYMTAVHEPTVSVVHEEAQRLPSRFTKSSFSSGDLIWCRETGGGKYFGSMMVNLSGHSHVVNSVSWNHDESKIVSGSYDKTVKVWDSNTGQLENTLEGHLQGVSSVSWNPDGSKIASGSWDKTIKIWEASTGRLLCTLEGHSDKASLVSWNCHGSKIASGSFDKTIRIWDAATGLVIHTLEGHLQTVSSISWNNEASKIVSGSHDNTIKVWDAVTGQLINTLEGHSKEINSVAWNHDGTTIASGSEDTLIKIWDATAGELLKTFEGHSSSVRSLAWNHDGSKIVSGSFKVIKIWDVTTSQSVNTLEGHSGHVQSVSWNHDGSKILSGSDDKSIRMWDTTAGGHSNSVEGVKGHSQAVYSVCLFWNTSGSKIVSGSGDSTIKIWDTATGQVDNTFEDHSTWVRSVSWKPDGSMIASGSEDKTVKIWNSTTGVVVHTLEGHSSPVWCVSWNHDGTAVASGSFDKTIKIWEPVSGRLLHTLEGKSPVQSISWNHDGSKIASGSLENLMRIWDVTTGQIVNSVVVERSLISIVSWSKDGSKIAFGSSGGRIGIWDASTEGIAHTIDRHSSKVSSISWNHDGSKIASGSNDCTIKIWDANTCQLLHTLEGHLSYVSSVLWNHQDTSQIVSGSGDTTIRIWGATTEEYTPV